MRDFDVQFSSGQDVLNAYWGYLSDGGLVIDDRDSLDVGDPIALSIAIASSGAAYNLRGKVVRRQPVSGHAVIAFDPGQPHDLLLSEALAETDNVPARRHRRYHIELDALVSGVGDETNDETRNDSNKQPNKHSNKHPNKHPNKHSPDGLRSKLVNISREGCCLHLTEKDRGSISVGSSISVAAGNFTVKGEVMWQRNLERGVRFNVGEASSLSILHEYLRSLDR